MLSHQELRRSRFYIVFLAVLASLGPIAIDAYLPMIPNIAEYYQTNIITVNLTMSTFLVGVGGGQFFGGALSDQFGRKCVGLIGLGVFSLASLCIVFAPSIYAVQGLRFIQALGGGFASVICLAQVRDLFPVDEVMRRFANVMMVVLLTPMLAPMLGALLISQGWQSVFVLLSALSLSFLLIYAFFIPETLLNKPERFSGFGMFAGYLYVVRHKVEGQLTAIRFILFSGFSAGVFITFITNSAFIYMERFELSPYGFALTFGLHGLAMMAGNRLAVKMSFHLTAHHVLKRFNLAQIGVTTGLCVLMMMGVNNLLGVVALTLCSMVVSGGLMPTAAGRFIIYFDKNVGAAVSLNTTIIYIGGGSIGALASVVSKGELLPVFLTMCVCAIVARLILLSIKDRSG